MVRHRPPEPLHPLDVRPIRERDAHRNGLLLPPPSRGLVEILDDLRNRPPPSRLLLDIPDHQHDQRRRHLPVQEILDLQLVSERRAPLLLQRRAVRRALELHVEVEAARGAVVINPDVQIFAQVPAKPVAGPTDLGAARFELTLAQVLLHLLPRVSPAWLAFRDGHSWRSDPAAYHSAPPARAGRLGLASAPSSGILATA